MLLLGSWFGHLLEREMEGNSLRGVMLSCGNPEQRASQVKRAHQVEEQVALFPFSKNILSSADMPWRQFEWKNY